MKIQGRKSQQMGALGPISIPAHPEPAPADPVSVSDRVDLTSTAQLRKLREAVQSMPAMRTERVEGLKGAIEEGSYYVESQKLAKKVVDDVLAEALQKELQGKQKR